MSHLQGVTQGQSAGRRLAQPRTMPWVTPKYTGQVGKNEFTKKEWSEREKQDLVSWFAKSKGKEVNKDTLRRSSKIVAKFRNVYIVIEYCVLAWRIPGTGEPGRLLSMGSHRVGHD